MILTNITDSFYNIKAMIEDCEEGGTIRCCVDGFVVWVFDFFFIDYLPPAGAALP